MSGTSAALTRAESVAKQKAVDLTPKGGKERGLKGEGSGSDPEHCSNAGKANPKSATKG